jgi:hypothetical protein
MLCSMLQTTTVVTGPIHFVKKIFEESEDFWKMWRFLKNVKIFQDFEIYEIISFETVGDIGEYLKNMKIFSDCWKFGDCLRMWILF